MNSVHMCSGFYRAGWLSTLTATLGNASPGQATTQRLGTAYAALLMHVCLQFARCLPHMHVVQFECRSKTCIILGGT